MVYLESFITSGTGLLFRSYRVLFWFRVYLSSDRLLPVFFVSATLLPLRRGRLHSKINFKKVNFSSHFTLEIYPQVREINLLLANTATAVEI